MFKLNIEGTFANKIGTGEWHNVDSSLEFLNWVAGGNTPEPYDPPTLVQLAMQRRQEILTSLNAIDAKSIRALRENDQARLAELDEQAKILRNQLNEVQL